MTGEDNLLDLNSDRFYGILDWTVSLVKVKQEF